MPSIVFFAAGRLSAGKRRRASGGKSLGAVTAQQGTSILDAALMSGIPIYHTCGGNASCGTCRVKVVAGKKNISLIEPVEAQILDSFDLKPSYRLSCQSLLLGGGVEVEIPEWDRAPRPNKTPKVP